MIYLVLCVSAHKPEMKSPVNPNRSNFGRLKSISSRILAMMVVVSIKNWTNIAIH